MGERKVLNKYYPPDFDPAKIPRRKNDKNKQIKVVRMMLPMSIRCSTCGTYIYKGTKFNSRKEDVVGETYLGIQIFPFYFKCTKWSAEITMKTDPQNSDYVVESGATRNYEPWRAGDEMADNERKQRDAEEMGDAMKTLENKAMDSKQDMDILAALEEMKSMKTRHETVSPEVLLAILTRARNEKEKQVEEVEKADEEIIKSIVFHNSKDIVRRIQDDDDDDDIEGGQASSNLDETEDHNFKRKRNLGNPTDSLTPISIFNSSKTGDAAAVVSKPKFVLKPRTATNGAKRLCVGPTESDKIKDEANTNGRGTTNVLQSLCASYDSDDSE